MSTELVVGGVTGFAAGLLGTRLLAAPIPQYLEAVAKNIDISVVIKDEVVPLLLKPKYYYENRYRWGPEGDPIYTRKSAVFAFVTPDYVFADGSWLSAGIIQAFCCIQDWTDNPNTNIYGCDIVRVTWDQSDVYYKGVALLTFVADHRVGAALPGLVTVDIAPDTLDIIPP